MRRRSCAADADPPAAGLGASLRRRPGRCRTSRRGSPQRAEQLDDVGLRAATLATVASTRYHSASPEPSTSPTVRTGCWKTSTTPSCRWRSPSTLVTTLIWSGHHDRLRDLFVPFCAELVRARRTRLARTRSGRSGSSSSWPDASDSPPTSPIVASSSSTLPRLTTSPPRCGSSPPSQHHRGDLDEAERVGERGLHIAEQDVPIFVVHFQGLLGLVALWSGNAQPRASASPPPSGRTRPAARASRASPAGAPTMLRRCSRWGAPTKRYAVLDSWETDAIRLEPVRCWPRCCAVVAWLRLRAGDVAVAESTCSIGQRPAAADARRSVRAARALLAPRCASAGGSGRSGPPARRSSRAWSSSRRAVQSGWTEKARAELGAIGGRRRESELTAAERRVAALAAEGRTNREVAAALFVGERTVETHLSHIYAKFGVRSRTELAVKLVPPNPEEHRQSYGVPTISTRVGFLTVAACRSSSSRRTSISATRADAPRVSGGHGRLPSS